MKYIKELDSVRAIALFFVLVCHWVKANNLITDGRLGMFGAIGVDMFFVLSGFLITGILLDGKSKSEESIIPVKTVFKNFYARRALRIFPIFYLVVFLLLIASFFNEEISRRELAYSATYTINFFIYKTKYWSGYTTHFWSLAVEEQFYLIWPMLLLLFKRKWLPYIMVFFMGVGIATQLLQNDEFGYLTTYTCFDSFAAGAIFSWMLKQRKDLIPVFFKVAGVLAIISLVIILIQFFKDETYFLPQRTLNTAVALWIIMTIVINNDRPAGYPLKWLFANRFLMFIGRISYGLYLYHLFIPYIGNFILQKLTGREFISGEIATGNYFFFFFNFLLLVGISYFSWVVIEKPILNLKRFFENTRRQ